MQRNKKAPHDSNCEENEILALVNQLNECPAAEINKLTRDIYNYCHARPQLINQCLQSLTYCPPLLFKLVSSPRGRALFLAFPDLLNSIDRAILNYVHPDGSSVLMFLMSDPNTVSCFLNQKLRADIDGEVFNRYDAQDYSPALYFLLSKTGVNILKYDPVLAAAINVSVLDLWRRHEFLVAYQLVKHESGVFLMVNHPELRKCIIDTYAKDKAFMATFIAHALNFAEGRELIAKDDAWLKLMTIPLRKMILTQGPRVGSCIDDVLGHVLCQPLRDLIISKPELNVDPNVKSMKRTLRKKSGKNAAKKSFNLFQEKSTSDSPSLSTSASLKHP